MVLVLFPPSAGAAPPRGSRPNIVFLFADDQCTYSVGCYGNRDVKTPQMDKLGYDGLIFERHYNTTAICMASRANVMTGMYAAVAILAALRHRDDTGRGQHIDLGLLDVQVAWLYNQGLNYLTGGQVPERLGTAHPNTVPYQAFETADGFIILAANNDGQFKRFLELAGREELLDDPRFATNPERIRNRDAVIATVQEILKEKPSAYWIEELERIQVSCCPINTIDQVFEDPQVLARGMKITMEYPLAGKGTVDLIGSPLKMSETPVSYRRPPPSLGEHTDEVLSELLGLDEEERGKLRADGLI